MAASITKHAYDTAASVAHRNAENVNGKTMYATASKATDTFDWPKREAMEQQRKLRLTQVRGQSKEIASQIRKKVEDEKQHQLDVVNKIKQNELLKWRQQQIAQTEGDFKTCLYQVGTAHLAAERETEKMKQIDAQRAKNRKLAVQRSRVAAEKVKAKRTANGKTRVKETQVHTVATQVDDSISAESDSDAASTLSSPSSTDSVCSVIARNSRKINSPKKFTSPSKNAKKKVQHNDYVAENFFSINSSTPTDVSIGIESPPVPNFTRVSDLLKKKSVDAPRVPAATATQTELVVTKPYVSKTFKLDKSTVEPRRSPPKKVTVRTVPARTGKSGPTHPASLTMHPIKKKTPPVRKPATTKFEIKPYVPRFITSKKPTATATATQTAPEATETMHNVQFYDHSNRFSKAYPSKVDLIENIEPTAPLNAMQEAKLEREREKNILLEMAKARKMEGIREEQAREKTKIRKDYDLMSTQLAELLKDEELTKRILQSNEIFSEKRLLEIEKERQQLMNADFERLLNRPPAFITCPKRANREPGNESVDGLNVAGRPSAPNRAANADNSDYSVESCNSFLLEYVTNRTANLANDIGKIRTDKAGDAPTNRKKIDALTSLLAKVNGLRKILTDEIDRNASNGKSNIDFIMRELDRVNERQAEIMLSGGMARNDDNKENVDDKRLIAERERILKMKESQLEEKVKELYLREKQLKNQKHLVTVKAKQPKVTAAENGSGDDTTLIDDIPVRITINVNKDAEKVETNVEKGKKWGEIIGTKNMLAGATEMETHTKTPVVNRTGRVYRKTPAKQKLAVEISSPSTTLTAYLSPPEAMQTELTKTLQQQEKQTKQMLPATDTVPLTNARDLDPQLLHYIVRLLGMTRTSIEQLNVSSVSTSSTPNSSVVNVSQNRKMSFSSISTTSWPEAMPVIDEAKWEQLNRFIAENYKFVSNLNDTINKTVTATAPAPASARRAHDVEPVWNELLANETAAKKPVTDQPKSIMRKKPSKPIQAKADEPTKNDLITKYDELTANCAKRINDLDQMISKVREEKQKLLENTLSSAGSLVNGNTKENITEYMDFPQDQRPSKAATDNGEATITLQTSTKSADSSAGSEQKSTTAAPSPEFSSSSGAAIAAIINKTGLSLTRTRQFGESKDSGVGGSRPVTSSDFRESPELRTKPNEQMDKFVPLLNDIPKPKISYRISDIIQSELQLEQGKRADLKERTTKLPPAALTRYSPNEEHAHELSTITEVDTPATSRLNATADLNAVAENAAIDAAHELQMQNRAALKQMLYNHFPDFQEYAGSTPNLDHASNSVDLSGNLTASASTILGEKLEKLLEITGQHTKQMKYKMFEAACEAAPTSAGNQPSLTYQQFPTHSEYAKDTSGLLDSQSIHQCQSSSDHNDTRKDQMTDESSLPDIINELKKRNILRESFEIDSYDEQKSGAGNSSATGTVAENLSDTLEKELHGLGIGWASSMLKKNKQASTVSSSSTTSSVSANDSHAARRSHSKPKRNSSPQKPQTTPSNTVATVASEDAKDDKAMSIGSQLDADTTTKPINLKEFLARELMKHSSSSASSSSISCNDSSIASIFLKSCLGNSSSNHSSAQLMPRVTNLEKQRTSTPVAGESSSGHRSMNSYKKSSSPQPPHLDYRTFPHTIDESDANASRDLTGKLFSGESHLSSVRGNNSDGSTSDAAIPSNTNTILPAEQRKHDEFEALITPVNVKLNSLGVGSSSTSSSST